MQAPMSERCDRLDKILSQQLIRERLSQRRAAICQRWVRAAERSISRLQRTLKQVRGGGSPGYLAKACWHQDHQRHLQALQSQLERIQRLRQRLQQRRRDKEAEVVRAAQYRRATEAALQRIEQEASRTRTRNTAKRLDQLVTLRSLGERQGPDATAIWS